MTVDKNQIMDVTCKDCGHVTKMSFGAVEANPTFKCEGCGQEITLNAENLRADLKRAEEKIKRGLKTFRV